MSARLCTIAWRLRPVTADKKGATIVEFAIVAPVLSVLMLGSFDIAHTLYARAVLQGIVQKTARDSALEAGTATAQQTALDNKVKGSIRALANNATITITRRYYRTFSQAAAARREDWTDATTGSFANGLCDGNEPYVDANRNNMWDRDGGDAGQGGAKDSTLYTVQMVYPRMFPLYNVVNLPRTVTLTASTVLKNQPYSDQAAYAGPVVRNCT